MSLHDDSVCGFCDDGCVRCAGQHKRADKYSSVPDGTMIIPIRLCLKLMDNQMMDDETRVELGCWYRDAN